MIRTLSSLFLAVTLPILVRAQAADPGSDERTASAGSRETADESKSVPLLVTVSGAAVASTSALAQESGSPSQDKPKPAKPKPSQQKPKSAKPTPSSDLERPPIEGSMVGYVDNAIVGSQVRIRFDAGFHDNAPDRAEFFYAQCECNRKAPRPPGPDFPGASTNINFQQAYFQEEFAPVSRRLSIFTEIPFRWIEPRRESFILGSFDAKDRGDQPKLGTRSGPGDVRAGIKLAIAASSDHSLTLQFRAYLPSGHGTEGLGTEHYSIEPSLLYYRRLSERWAVESQIGDWEPIGGSEGTAEGAKGRSSFAGNVFFYGIGPSYQLIDGAHVKFAPVVELFGWSVLGGLQTTGTFKQGCNGDTNGCPQPNADTHIINLKVGARTSIGPRNSFYVGFGQAITHSVWYKHIVRAEYRHSF